MHFKIDYWYIFDFQFSSFFPNLQKKTHLIWSYKLYSLGPIQIWRKNFGLTYNYGQNYRTDNP